jgi:ketosteroid isomerase-like protein
MNKFARVLNRAVAVGLLGLALVPANAQAASKVEKELIALQQEWANARIKGDVAFLEKFYAREFWITAMNGSVVKRDADIAMFASQEMRPEAITDEDMNVAVHGMVAIVTGRENVKGTYRGVPGEFALRFTNVFVRRHASWQLLTHHATEISKEVLR